MKKLLLLVLCMIILVQTVVFAADLGITVMVNGSELKSDVSPQIVNDRTMLPMRAIFEELGADVSWLEADKIVLATKNDLMIVLQIDNYKMSVQSASEDGNNVIELDAAPYIHEGRTMVPVRAIAEALKADVKWDDVTRTVTITQ